jgi:hypothetical protein
MEQLDISHRALTKGGGPSGAVFTGSPLGNTDAPAGGASAASVAGGLPGSTTTRVPTFTRVYRSVTSSFVSRMQPEDTKVPMVDG